MQFQGVFAPFRELWAGASTTVLPAHVLEGKNFNKVWNTCICNPKTKQPYELESRPSEQDPQESKEGTKMRYHFTSRADTPLPPIGAEVTLRYRTPSRLVAFTVPFEFRAVPLP